MIHLKIQIHNKKLTYICIYAIIYLLKERQKRGIKMTDKKQSVWNEDSIKKFREYQNNFIRHTYQAYTIRFNREKDEEVIKHLEAKGRITSYIRNLIEADMEKEKKKAAKK